VEEVECGGGEVEGGVWRGRAGGGLGGLRELESMMWGWFREGGTREWG